MALPIAVPVDGLRLSQTPSQKSLGLRRLIALAAVNDPGVPGLYILLLLIFKLPHLINVNFMHIYLESEEYISKVLNY